MGARRPDNQRVVVTGMGVVTPIGDTVETFWTSLVNGRSGIGRWKRPIDERCCARIGGDLGDFDLAGHLQRQARYAPDLVKRCLASMRASPMVPKLVAAAALQAWHDAGLPGCRDTGRVGHVMAGHNVNAGYIVENALTFHQSDPDYIEPLFGLHCLDTDVLAASSELLSLHGPCFTVGGACASGNLAILAALDLLRAGRADAVLVSGAPIELEPVALHGWTMLEALSYRSFNDLPERASRPFDALREGFVPSEGAGALVLERLEAARARGADIHGELLGASATSDASRLTRPDLDGQVRAMQLALDDARVDAGEVDYVNAHATSTRLGDAVEAAAITRVLGARARTVPVNATKSMLGHCLSAAGVVEAVATVLQMTHGIVHATINQEQRDPEIDLDVVPNRARPAAVSVALSNSFGFGGLNSSVVLSHFDE
ncbi:MAG TPA: beta-ketoacyl-[acyl-carrier-protein] synthase family protein [Vicinamibacterales bacterium]|nr:beta-ketoacyl-[acyl-carrier-protein] synthase family protein [Vicinamibacterales bacterium]